MLPYIPLHFLCIHFWQIVHSIELLPTSVPQTPHGHLTAFCVTFCHSPLIKTLVLFIHVFTFAFCLLFLYSLHACVDFLFSNFHTFSSFPLLLQQVPHSTTTFPYACMGLLTIHMWPVLYPSLYFSLPMFIYIKVFPLCFRYLIFDYALVFFMSFPPWASIHALLVQTSYAIFLLY